MYGISDSEFIGVLLLWGGLIFAICLCLLAFFLFLLSTTFTRKAARHSAIVSILFSIVSGLSLILLQVDGRFCTARQAFITSLFIVAPLITSFYVLVLVSRNKKNKK